MRNVADGITIQDFKDRFSRDFRYLPVWQDSINYFTNDKVYYELSKNFYVAKINNINILPTDVNTWQITKDNTLLYVSDAELQKALDRARDSQNYSLCFPSDTFLIEMVLLLTAHLLYLQLNGAGTQSDAGLYETSRQVGKISQSFTVPEFMTKSPVWLFYQKSGYGIQYVVQMYPLLGLASFRRVDTKTR